MRRANFSSALCIVGGRSSNEAFLRNKPPPIVVNARLIQFPLKRGHSG